LTYAIPLVTKISTALGISEQTLLEAAAGAERNFGKEEDRRGTAQEVGKAEGGSEEIEQ
jgi:hypothetical protein